MKISLKRKDKASKKVEPAKKFATKSSVPKQSVVAKSTKKPTQTQFVKPKPVSVSEANFVLGKMQGHFRSFYSQLFGEIRKDDLTYQEAEKRIQQFYSVMKKHKIDDYDMMVSIKYRIGKKRNPISFIEEQDPKSIVDVLCEGFDIPADISLLKLEVHPAVKNANETTIFKEKIYELKVGVAQKEQRLSAEQLKNRYGLDEDGMLLTTSDLEGNIFKFYSHDINKDPYYKTHYDGSVSQL